MITLQLYSKALIDSPYTISRSNKIYSYLKNEYGANSTDEYDYLFMSQSKKRKSKITEFLSKKDNSVKIPLGCAEYTFFATEYNKSLPEDYDHNIIVPEGTYNYKK